MFELYECMNEHMGKGSNVHTNCKMHCCGTRSKTSSTETEKLKACWKLETVPNHKWGIPCHLPFPLRSLSLSSSCDVCVLCGDASACSPFQEEHERLHTLLCGLGKERCKFYSNSFPPAHYFIQTAKKGKENRINEANKWRTRSDSSMII